jgi:hypothetical protein
MRRTPTQSLALALTLALLAAAVFVPAAATDTAAAQSQETVTVSGDVVVENGTADGDNVTVTPLTQDFRAAGQQVRTTVSGGTFAADGVTKAALYFVRLEHAGAAHYRLVSSNTGANFRLGPPLTGRVVTDEGDPVANRTLLVQSPLGPPVTRITTDENGSFSVAPMRPNATYRVSVMVTGLPYRWRVQTGPAGTTNGTDARLVARDPSSNESLLVASGGNPASHVLQVVPAQSGDGYAVVETINLRNRGDRPFVGTVTVGLPANASGVQARYDNNTVPVRRVDGDARINATLAANATTRLAVRYEVPTGTVDKRIAHDADRVAVVLQGYNVSNVESSPNLAPGDSPIPLLTNEDPVSAGDRISVTLPGQPSGSTGGQSGGSAPSSSAGMNGSDGERMPEFPTLPLVGGLAATVVGSIAAYRVF